MWLEISIFLVIVFYIFHKYKTRNNDYFKKKNIPHIPPTFWFGNFPGSFLGTEAVTTTLIKISHHFKGERIYGLFDFAGPVIVMKDPEIIKQVAIKDSEHFVNHRPFFQEAEEEMFGNSIFQLRNEKWKDMRHTLTPAFTGNKMRIMFDLIREVAEDSVGYVRNELKMKPEGIELDIKDYFTRFTNDVIATCAFGIKVNSLADRNNQFYVMGKKINTFDFAASIRFFLLTNFPLLCKILRIRLFSREHITFFKDLVLNAMDYRKKNNILRPDMINMLMEARDNPDRKRDWTDNELVAQCFGFFMAGFETTGTTLCFAALEIAMNDDVQDKLVDEINDVKENLNGKPLNYEALQGMKYLDMVVTETLRKWPGAPFTDRQCNKDYELKIDEDNSIQLKPGDSVSINIFALHYDEENFPEPFKFDPERFNDENKDSIKPNTYLPFGIGPRNCIGNRFAIMEIKAILFCLLSEFKFVLSKKVKMPLELKKTGFQLIPDGGFWMKFENRN